MPKTKQQKQEMLAQMATLVREARGIVFSTFSGIDIKGIEQLRKILRENGVLYRVFKKTIIKKVFKDKGIDCKDVDEWFGNIGVAASFDDEIAPAKILVLTGKERAEVKIEAGMLEGKFIDGRAVRQLAMLPGKEELIAKLIGSIRSPLSSFMNVLQGNQRLLITVLSQIRDKRRIKNKE